MNATSAEEPLYDTLNSDGPAEDNQSASTESISGKPEYVNFNALPVNDSMANTTTYPGSVPAEYQLHWRNQLEPKEASYIDGFIDGLYMPRMLIDTGATITACNLMTYRMLLERNSAVQEMPLDPRKKIQVANGQIMYMKKKLYVDFLIGQYRVKHPVFVAEHLTCDLVLGHDFLLSNRFDLVLSESRIRTPNGELAIQFGKRATGITAYSEIETEDEFHDSEMEIEPSPNSTTRSSATNGAQITIIDPSTTNAHGTGSHNCDVAPQKGGKKLYVKFVSALFYAALFFLLLPLISSKSTPDPKDVFVFLHHGAVAERCGAVALDRGASYYPMILRFQIHSPNMTQSNCTSYLLRNELLLSTNNLPTWLSGGTSTYVSNPRRRKRFVPILIAAAAIGVVGIASSLYSLYEVRKVKEMQSAIIDHMNTLTDFVRQDHDNIVKVARLTHNLYEYTHQGFRQLAEEMRDIRCTENADIQALIFILRRNFMLQKLYADFGTAAASLFSQRPSPALLPYTTISSLIREHEQELGDTVYLENMNYVYQFGTIHPIFPFRHDALGFILRLPRITQPNLRTLYCINNLGHLLYTRNEDNKTLRNDNVQIRYSLPEKVVYRKENNGSELVFMPINLKHCTNFELNSYVCSEEGEVNDNDCLYNVSNCDYKVRTVNQPIIERGRYGLAFVSNQSCQLNFTGGSNIRLHTLTGFHFIGFQKAVVDCGAHLRLSTENEVLNYSFHYLYDAPRILGYIPKEVITPEWTEKTQLEQLIMKMESENINNFIVPIDIMIYVVLAIIIVLILIAVALWVYCKCYHNRGDCRRRMSRVRRRRHRRERQRSPQMVVVSNPSETEIGPPLTNEIINSYIPVTNCVSDPDEIQLPRVDSHHSLVVPPVVVPV